MSKAARLIGATIAGFATAFILVIAVEFYSSIVHPFPAGFQGTSEEMCLHVARYPQWVLATAIPMWSITALAGTWVAGRLGNRGSALFLAVLLLAAVILNMAMLPYPLWFKIIMPFAVAAALVLGYGLSPRPAIAALQAP